MTCCYRHSQIRIQRSGVNTAIGVLVSIAGSCPENKEGAHPYTFRLWTRGALLALALLALHPFMSFFLFVLFNLSKLFFIRCTFLISSSKCILFKILKCSGINLLFTSLIG